MRRLILLSLLAFTATAAAQGRGEPWQAPVRPTVSDRVIIFDNYHGLWRTDGTPAGTYAIDREAVDLLSTVVMNGKVYVLTTGADRVTRLCVLNGNRREEIASFEGLDVWSLGHSRSRLFFFSRSRYFNDCVRLWTSDGTANGTRVIAALFTDEAKSLVAAGERMLFKLYAAPRFEWNGRSDYDTWSTDGTTAGTGPLLTNVPWFTAFGDAAFFWDDGLKRTDGTAAGTSLITDASPINTSSDAIYFASRTGPTYSLGKSDGTAAGVRSLGTAGFYPAAIADLGGRTLAFKVVKEAVELWVIESGGAARLLTALPRRSPAFQYSFESDHTHPLFRQIGDVAYIRMQSLPDRDEVWRTDGTLEGTYAVSSLPGLSLHYAAPPLFALNGRLVFWATDGIHGFEPWTTGGNANDARMVRNTVPEGTIRGRVTDAGTGAPVSGAVIEVHARIYGADHLYVSEPVDADGRYTIEGLIGEQLYVKARSTGSHLSQIHGAPECTNCPPSTGTLFRMTEGNEVDGVDFALERGGRIAGRVVDRSGKPLPNVTIRVARSIAAAPEVTANTAPDGTYLTTGVKAGVPWVVSTAGHPGYSAMVYEGATVRAKEIRGGIDFALKPYGTLQGRVIDAMTGGRPKTRVMIAAWSADRTLTAISLNYPDHVAWTDDAGNYELTLPDGKYRVMARGNPLDYTSTWYPNRSCITSCLLPDLATVSPIAGAAVVHDFVLQPGSGR